MTRGDLAMGQLDLFTPFEEVQRREIARKKAVHAYIQARKKQNKKVRKKLKNRAKSETRTHFIFPTYKKFYSVYQFNWEEYAKRFSKIRKRAYSLYYGASPKKALKYWLDNNPHKIAKDYYILNEIGEPIHLGDEKHIYRISTLITIHRLIYNYCDREINQKRITTQYGLILHHEDQEAELENTWQLPIKQRLKLHIQVLRNLQNGKTLEESTKEIEK